MKRLVLFAMILLLLLTSTVSAFIVDTGDNWRLTGTTLYNCTLSGTTASALAAVRWEDANWYYVDSAATGDADGSTWDNAYTTVDAAINACTGYTEYVLLVNANHNEALTTADGVDVDVANVKIIGMGVGSSKPRFDYDGADGEFVIGAAGCKLVNLSFMPGINTVTHAIDVENAGDYAEIIGCDFIEGEAAGTDEFVDSIVVGTTATNVVVRKCSYFCTGANANTFVYLNAATIANATVTECTIFGPFLESAIWWGAAVPTNVSLIGNVITNTDADQSCIEGSGNATGVCLENKLCGNTYGAILLPGLLRCSGNTQTLVGGKSEIDVPLIAGKTYALSKVATSDDDDLFDVQGGPILITSFVGVVTTEIGNAANALEINLDADAGWTDYDFSTAVDLDSDAAGTRYVFSNANESVLTPLEGADAGSTTLMTPWYCGEGMIEQANAGAGTTGAITWYMTFIPLDGDIVVVPQ